MTNRRRRLFALVLAGLLVLAGPASALWPGEEVREGAGHPSLIRFWPGDPAKPMVVFVPGAHHAARIAYGHPDGREEDFLAHWVRQAGYSFLAVSYPIATEPPVLEEVDPGFTVEAWGEQVADIARQTVEANGLGRELIVLGWSMGGKIAHAVNQSAMERDLDVAFYVSLSATPPLPLLAGSGSAIKEAPDGLADRRDIYGGWVEQLAAQNALNGHEIIPEEVFRRDYLGFIPINIQGYDWRYRPEGWIQDRAEGLEDTGTFDYAGFPLVTTLVADHPLEARHALTDEGSWGLFQVAKIYNDYLGELDPEALPAADWRALVELVRDAPERLSLPVHGTHFFFVGEAGARQTAQSIAILENVVAGYKKQLGALAGIPIE